MSKYISALRKSRNLEGTLILPSKLFREVASLAEGEDCPDNEAYIIDDEGGIHTFKYLGKLPQPGEAGYLEMEPEGDAH